MDYSKPADGVQKSPPPTAPPPYGGHHEPPPAIGMPVPHAHGGAPGPWSSGLCGCFSDVPNCCMTFWCPCVTFGQIAEIVDKGSTSCGASGALYTLILLVTGCSCIYSFFYRQKMRKQYMLSESPCNDFIIHCCCEYCALCQEYRELKHRGFDMALGWQGNVDNRTQGVAMAPVVEGGMTR